MLRKYGLLIAAFLIAASSFAQVVGCMDPEALNYLPQATEDSGNCIYAQECGNGDELFTFTFGAGLMNDYTAQLTDLSFQDTLVSVNGYLPFQEAAACLHPDSCYVWHFQKGSTFPYSASTSVILQDSNLIAFDYIEFGLGHDFRKYFSPSGVDCGLGGCTDENALNYMPNATINFGCVYCLENLITVRKDTLLPDLNNSWGIYQNGTLFTGGYGQGISPSESIRCLPDGCYEFWLHTDYEPLESSFNKYYLENEDNVLLWQGYRSHDDTVKIPFNLNVPDTCFDENVLSGCTNPLGVNYDPDVTVYDGSCDLDNDLCAYTFEFELDTVNEGTVIINTDIWSPTSPWIVQWNIDDTSLVQNYALQYSFTADGPVSVCVRFYAFEELEATDPWQLNPFSPYCMDTYCLEFDPLTFGFSQGEQIVFQTPNDETSLSENIQGSIRCFPNPAKETLWVDLKAAAGLVNEMEVFDANGRSVLTAKVQNHNKLLQLDLSELPTGAYILKVRTNEMVYNRRIIRQ